MADMETSKTVAFRLDPVTLGRLDERAIAAGKTRGDLARGLVKQALAGSESKRMLDAIETVRVAVGRVEARTLKDSEALESLMKMSVAGLLVVLGGYTEEKAAKWVDFYLSGSDET